MIDQLVAEFAGDLRLQLLDLFRGELDHLAVAQIDQVVVVRVGNLFEPGATLAEIVPFDDAGILEQFYRSIHGRYGDAVVDFSTAAVQFFNVRVIFGFVEHARDDVEFIQEAAAIEDAESLRVRAHRLKGSAHTFGAEQLGDKAAEIEQLAKGGKTSIDQQVSDLIHIFQRTKSALRQGESQRVEVKA